jgi:hypothetical protein
VRVEKWELKSGRDGFDWFSVCTALWYNDVFEANGVDAGYTIKRVAINFKSVLSEEVQLNV